MFDEDLSIFVDDFGIEVTFTRASTTIATSKLILNAPALDSSVYDRSFYDEKFYAARVQQAVVELLGIASEVSAVQYNDIAVINSVTWYVIGLEPDGTGMMIIILSVNPT